MDSQLAFIDIPEAPKDTTNNLKRNWECRFQRWSDRLHDDESTPLGKCGCGAICDYCDGAFDYKNPCVRALHNMQKEINFEIDYSKDNYGDVFMLRKVND